MDKEQVKKFIAEKVSEGFSLAKILELLKAEKVSMTFMDLRLLASELESVDWSKTDKVQAKPVPKEVAKPAQAEAIEDEVDEALSPEDDLEEGALPEEESLEGEPKAPAGPRGATKVEVHKLVKPGFLACGTVQFGSGASAGWFVDQYGRLGLEKAIGKPDQKDVEEFQAELQKIFAQQGL